MDHLALYKLNYFDYKSDNGIMHILQRAIQEDFYDEIRRQMVDNLGEDRIAGIEKDYKNVLDLYREEY